MFHNLENRMEKIQEAINTINTIAKNIEKIKIKQRQLTQFVKYFCEAFLALE